MIREIEISTARELDTQERAEVAKANRRYFESIDEVREGETMSEKQARLGNAANKRMEVISNLVGAEADADELVSAAMNVL